ncbi:MAG: hypothetical protein JSS81_12650 [Acidobacteria bacterium]|nr:hypothetical protein [Acidobacteriota bacterium]
MKNYRTVCNLTIVALIWFCLAFSCQNRERAETPEKPGKTPADSSAPTRRSRSSPADSVDLAGTDWTLLSMTEKGATPRDSGTTPNVEFCTNGKWAIRHYSSLQGGAWEQSGDRLTMRDENGRTYADGTLSLDGEVLTIDDSDYTFRLRYLGPADCK